MIDLNDIFYFVQIVDKGSFTAAGTSLRVPKSTLSHRMQQLEGGLGVRLLNRTPRKLAMTDAGEEFYRYAVGALQQAEQAEHVVRQRLAEPAGTIRFTVAIATSQFAMRDMLADFIAAYPKVDLVQHATDEPVDIIGQNFDVAVRSHSRPLPDSTLVRRKLATAPWILIAGSRYAAQLPTVPEELEKHPSFFMARTNAPIAWKLRRAVSPEEEIIVPLKPRLLSDDMVSLKRAACAGLGIVALPAYVCRDEIRSGELVHVLPDWVANESTITALFRYREGLLPSVRVFLDHLAREFPKIVLP